MDYGHLGRHAAAHRPLVIAQHHARDIALGLGQRAQQAIRDFCGQLIQQGHAVFRIELIEELVNIGIAQLIDDIRLVLGIEGIKDGDRFLARQQAQGQRRTDGILPLDDGDELLQRHLIQKLLQARGLLRIDGIFLLQPRLDDIASLLGGFRHRPVYLPCPWVFIPPEYYPQPI